MDAERIVGALISALDAERPLIVGQGKWAKIVMVPDHRARLRAASALLDCAIGRPGAATRDPPGLRMTDEDRARWNRQAGDPEHRELVSALLRRSRELDQQQDT